MQELIKLGLFGLLIAVAGNIPNMSTIIFDFTTANNIIVGLAQISLFAIAVGVLFYGR